MDNLPGLEDRGALLAAFSGAMAYLCTREKLPILLAVTYAFAGTVTAVYVGPGLIEWFANVNGIKLGVRSQAMLIFFVGVGGIWLLNLVVSILQAANKRADDFVTGLLNRIFNTQPKNNNSPPQDEPPKEEPK